jgi:hypothetical protein
MVCVCCVVLTIGASLWDKTRETLRAEATLRRIVVNRLDNELRSEEMYLRNMMRSLRRDKERKEAERRQQMRDRHLKLRKEEGKCPLCFNRCACGCSS